jgi:hypothetical protein
MVDVNHRQGKEAAVGKLLSVNVESNVLICCSQPADNGLVIDI